MANTQDTDYNDITYQRSVAISVARMLERINFMQEKQDSTNEILNNGLIREIIRLEEHLEITDRRQENLQRRADQSHGNYAHLNGRVSHLEIIYQELMRWRQTLVQHFWYIYLALYITSALGFGLIVMAILRVI